MHTILLLIPFFFYLIALSIPYIGIKNLSLIKNSNKITHNFVKVLQNVTKRGGINGNDRLPAIENILSLLQHT